MDLSGQILAMLEDPVDLNKDFATVLQAETPTIAMLISALLHCFQIFVSCCRLSALDKQFVKLLQMYPLLANILDQDHNILHIQSHLQLLPFPHYLVTLS